MDNKLNNNIQERFFSLRLDTFLNLYLYGRCFSVERAVSNRSLNAMEYTAICDAYKSYINNTKFLSQDIPRTKQFFGGKRTKFEDFELTDAHYNELINYIKIAAQKQDFEIHVSSVEPSDEEEILNSVKEQSKTTARAYLENLEKEVEQIKKNAEEEAYRIKEEASAEAVQARADATTEALRIKATAEAEARCILEEAERERESVKSEAVKEAEEIRENAKLEASKTASEIIENAKKEAEAITSGAFDERYKDKYEARLKEYFINDRRSQDEIRKELNSDFNSVIEARNKTLDSMNEGARNLHSSFMQAFEESFENLRKIQNDMHTELDSWRRNLYKNELEDVARCFYTLDKIIVAMKNKIASELAFGEEGYHNELAQELSKQVKTLEILKNNFEKSLAKSSIKVIIPEIGETFNSNYHCAENFDPYSEDEDSLNGKPISEVTASGIVRELNSGDNVIMRAMVKVEK